jgi:hypothetical protein
VCVYVCVCVCGVCVWCVCVCGVCVVCVCVVCVCVVCVCVVCVCVCVCGVCVCGVCVCVRVVSFPALRFRFPFCTECLVISLYDTHEAETQLIRFLDCGTQLIRPLLSFPFESLRFVDYFESSGIINMLSSAKFGSPPWV